MEGPIIARLLAQIRNTNSLNTLKTLDLEGNLLDNEEFWEQIVGLIDEAPNFEECDLRN